jgi:hypothetical protein
MRRTVPGQHPAVVLRSNYQQLRALRAVALITIVGLTIAVVVMATSNATTSNPGAQRTAAPTSANPSAKTGARLDHSERKLQLEHQLNRS